MRGYRDMPALMLTLERMGLSNPAVLARVARAAHALTVSGDTDRAVAALVRWQSALALIEQIQRRRHLALQDLEPLVTSLADTALVPLDRADGAVGAWIVEQLTPKFVPAGTPRDRLERAALESWLSGPAGDGRRFEWDGLPYVVDFAGKALSDATALRATSPAPSIGDLVALHAVWRRIEDSVTTLDDIKPLIAELERLKPAVASVPADKNAGGEPTVLLQQIIDDLGRITQARDLKKTSRTLPRLRRLVDAFTAAITPPLAYALAMAPLAQPAIYADAWRHHPLIPPQVGRGALADRRVAIRQHRCAARRRRGAGRLVPWSRRGARGVAVASGAR